MAMEHHHTQTMNLLSNGNANGNEHLHHHHQSIPSDIDPPMTFDEASLHGSRHFYMALQELKNLSPQLYSAAEYCESSYLFNDQKQIVLENLKDYTVKAIVNAVDHLGTVAYKLEEVLSQQIGELGSTEMRVTNLTRRMHSCKEQMALESYSEQSSSRAHRTYHKHYLLPDVVSNYDDDAIARKNQPIPDSRPARRSSGRTLSWHLAVDPITSVTKPYDSLEQDLYRPRSSTSMSENLEQTGSVLSPGYVESSSKTSTIPSTTYINDPVNLKVKVSSSDTPKPLKSHSSFHEKFNYVQHQVQSPLSSRSRSLLSSLFGRRRSGKRQTDY